VYRPDCCKNILQDQCRLALLCRNPHCRRDLCDGRADYRNIRHFNSWLTAKYIDFLRPYLFALACSQPQNSKWSEPRPPQGPKPEVKSHRVYFSSYLGGTLDTRRRSDFLELRRRRVGPTCDGYAPEPTVRADARPEACELRRWFQRLPDPWPEESDLRRHREAR
jgi:hypothetical protein